MKQIRKISCLMIAFAILSLMLCSCGGADKSFAAEDSSPAMNAENSVGWGWDAVEDADYEVEAPVEAEVMPEEGYAPNPSTSSTPDAPEETGDKIIKNGNLSVETLEFDKFVSDLAAAVAQYNGYIEESSTYGSRKYRSADYTIRIPYKQYDSFIGVVGNLATITSSSESIENVTLQYVDIEARLNALKAERDSFMELMDKAETIDEILQIQSYLTDVNYQIESYTSQLRALENKVSYSTIRINVSEVVRITPEEPKTVWERISTGFSESLYNVKEGLKSFFVGFVVATPYLAVYAVFVAIIVVVIVVIIKASKKKQQKRIEEHNRRQQEQNQSDNK